MTGKLAVLYACRSAVREIKPTKARLAGLDSFTGLSDLAASWKTDESWSSFCEGQDISSRKSPDWL